MAETQGPEAQLQDRAAQVGAVDHDLGGVLGQVGQARQGQTEQLHAPVQIRAGLDHDPGGAAVEARGHVEVGHHGLRDEPVRQDVHVTVLGAQLDGPPGHRLYLADEGLPARATAEGARDLHPVPFLEGGVQVEGDAREQVAQHLLEAEANDRGGDGAGAQQLAQAHLQHLAEDAAGG